MSTVLIDKIDKQEAKPLSPKDEKQTERAALQRQSVRTEVKADPTTAERHPSCLDLAAEFLARG